MIASAILRSNKYQIHEFFPNLSRLSRTHPKAISLYLLCSTLQIPILVESGMLLLGSVAEWISIIVSSAALLAAFFAWQETKKLNQIELGRDEQQRERERSAQARLINAWIVAHHDPNNYKEVEWGVVLDNKSDSPIFRVAIVALDKEGAQYSSVIYNIFPPGKYYLKYKKDSNKRVNFHFPLEITKCETNLHTMTKGKWAVISLAFDDANNQSWTRLENGQLLAIQHGAETATASLLRPRHDSM